MQTTEGGGDWEGQPYVAERPGKMMRTMTMKDAISSDGKPEDDALGDAEPVQHRQHVMPRSRSVSRAAALRTDCRRRRR